MWWNCLASCVLYLNVWAVHSSDNLSCPYFSIVVVGNKCFRFLIDGRVDYAVKESHLCSVGLEWYLSWKGIHLILLKVNEAESTLNWWIKYVTLVLAAWFRLGSDATGKAETRCLKGVLSAVHLHNSVSFLEMHHNLLHKFDWKSGWIEGSTGTS